MKARRIVALVALTVASGGLGQAAAHADSTPTYIYVNTSSCSDSGTGTLALPYCTIQAAANAALPGQTVLLPPEDLFTQSVVITRSGSPGAPITFEGGMFSSWDDTGDTVQSPSGPAITIQGVQDIAVRGLTLEGNGADPAVTISDSSDITFDTDHISGVSITGTSSDVTVSRSGVFAGEGSTAISVGAGASSVAISTNEFPSSVQAVTVQGATGTAVTGNSMFAACQTSIALTQSASSTIENNLINGPAAPGCKQAPAVAVSADSTAGTTLDYNAIRQSADSAPTYQWAGTGYTDATQLDAATGQGAHDINAVVGMATSGVGTYGDYITPTASAVTVDSADANAPGELSTDVDGQSRVDDPFVANTGTGVGFHDRGAIEYQDPLTATLTTSATQLPAGATLTASTAVTDPWSATDTVTYDFGDGSAPVVSSSGAAASHVYPATGAYELSATITNAYGVQIVRSASINVDDPAPLQASITKSGTGGALSAFAEVSATGAWSIASSSVDFGDGTAPEEFGGAPYANAEHTYAKPGTYTITYTATDAGGNTATASTVVTTSGADYTALGPVRVLDTRNGTGTAEAPLTSAAPITLQLSGVDGIPANATAVAINLTVTNTTGSGNVAAYPAGTTPTTSNLNYTAGQTVPNMAIVPLGQGGEIQLAKQGPGQVDLIGDVAGYFTPTAAAGYTPASPTRILDTRNGTGSPLAPLTAAAPIKLQIAGNAGIPADVTAVAVNLTLTDSTGYGNVIAYPDGTTQPATSNLNYTAGLIVANAAIVPVTDGYIDLAKQGPGQVDLMADLEGYFTSGGTSAYVPITPVRAIDTRNTGSLGANGELATGATLNDLTGVTASAYVLNATVTNTAADGFLTVAPDMAAEPDTSTLDWTAGATVPNLALATANNYGALDFYNNSSGPTDLIVDLFGYFATS